MNNMTVYKFPGSYAEEYGETILYRISMKANIACKEAIEAAIHDGYRNNSLDVNCVAAIIGRFGMERVKHVLSTTVHLKLWDGRFSTQNKAWAAINPVFEDISYGYDMRRNYVVNSHSGLVDLFINEVRRIEATPANGENKQSKEGN